MPKKKNDGTYYKDFFYYACKHRLRIDGHHCDYHRQWSQEKVNRAVEETIKRMVSNTKFKAALKDRIGTSVDKSELLNERDNYRKKLQQCIGAKNKLSAQLDALDVTDKLYDSFTDIEKKRFMQSFVEDVQIYEEPKGNGRFLKSISFAFPVYYNDKEFTTIAFGEDALKQYADNLTKENIYSWDKDFTDETVALLSKLLRSEASYRGQGDRECYEAFSDDIDIQGESIRKCVMN